MRAPPKSPVALLALALLPFVAAGSPFGRKQGASVPLADIHGKRAFSSHRCVGQTFAPDQWKGSSCYYRNLCYDVGEDEWVYYAAAGERLPRVHDLRHEAQWIYPNMSTSYDDAAKETLKGRGLLLHPLDVNLTPYNRLWKGYAPSRWKHSGYKWRPRIVRGDIPAHAVWDNHSAVFVLYMSYVGHNLGHLMYDELLPAFTLMQMFDIVTNNVQLLNVFLEKPAWNTCFYYLMRALEGGKPFPEDETDVLQSKSEPWIKWNGANYANTCASLYRKTSAAHMGPKHAVSAIPQRYTKYFGPKGTMKFPPNPDEEEDPEDPAGAAKQKMPALEDLQGPRWSQELREATLICHSRVLAGSGMLAEHCADESVHGMQAERVSAEFVEAGGLEDDDTGNAKVFCNAGRGPQFWQFRHWMLNGMGLAEYASACTKAPGGDMAKLVLLATFSLRDTESGKADMETVADWTLLATTLAAKPSNRLKTTAVQMHTMTMREQVQLMLDSQINVVGSGGGASLAIFMPRGSTIILLCPKDNKDDFVLFDHVSTAVACGCPGPAALPRRRSPHARTQTPPSPHALAPAHVCAAPPPLSDVAPNSCVGRAVLPRCGARSQAHDLARLGRRGALSRHKRVRGQRGVRGRPSRLLDCDSGR